MEADVENLLPKNILDKAIRRGNEYGWKKEDFIDVVRAAKSVNLVIVGGQIQFIFPDGTCELYWLNYDPQPRKEGESWTQYCERSADECIAIFKERYSDTEIIIQDAVNSFVFIQEKIQKEQMNVREHLYFIVYFSSEE